MHPMPARVGGLLVITGFTFAVLLGAGWATVIGAVMLVAGGLTLAVAAEPMLDVGETALPRVDVTESVEPERGVAA